MAPLPPQPPALARYRRPPSGRHLIALGVRLLAQDRALAAQRRDELAQAAADRAVRGIGYRFDG